MTGKQTTDFGYKRVEASEKTRRVSQVFTSVAGRYDLMNDLMSMGVHRLWKRYAIHLSQVRPDSKVLDVAGGTGDMARLYHQIVGDKGQVVISDINIAMLDEGRKRMLDSGITSGISYVQADAELLPFADNTFDCISIAFGLRNVTDKPKALGSMYDKLKFGGKVVILEFSRVILPLLKQLYDTYSFRIIPLLGKIVAKDEESYRYLVESIRMHPDQEALQNMMVQAGFSKVTFNNLSGGVVAIHKGFKI